MSTLANRQYISSDGTGQWSPPSNAGTRSTTLTVNRATSATTQMGDVYVAFITRDPTQTLTPPDSNWKLISSISNGTNLVMDAYYYVDYNTAFSTAIWTVSSSTQSWGVTVHGFRAIDPDVVVAAVATATSTTATTVANPTVVAPHDNTLVVYARACMKTVSGNVTYTAGSPSPGTEIADSGFFDSQATAQQRSLGVYYTENASAGTVSAAQTVASSAPSNSVQMTIAFEGLQVIQHDAVAAGVEFAPIKHVASNGSYGVANTATCTITKPSGLAVGDVMLAIVVDTTDGLTSPSGWTTLETFDEAPSYTWRCRVDYKVANSTDVAATNFTWSSSNGGLAPLTGSISAFRGCDQLNPVTGFQSANTTGAAWTQATGTPAVDHMTPAYLVALRGTRCSVATIPTQDCDTSLGLYRLVVHTDGGNHGASTAYQNTIASLGNTLPGYYFTELTGATTLTTHTTGSTVTDRYACCVILKPQMIQPQLWAYKPAVTRSSRW